VIIKELLKQLEKRHFKYLVRDPFFFDDITSTLNTEAMDESRRAQYFRIFSV
jgi:hypothetical protein